MIEYRVEVDTDGDKHWYLNGQRLAEQRTMTKPTCSGKEVTIDGVTYVLQLKGGTL